MPTLTPDAIKQFRKDSLLSIRYRVRTGHN